MFCTLCHNRTIVSPVCVQFKREFSDASPVIVHTNKASLLVSLKQVNNHTACMTAANAMIYLIYQRKTHILQVETGLCFCIFSWWIELQQFVNELVIDWKKMQYSDKRLISLIFHAKSSNIFFLFLHLIEKTINQLMVKRIYTIN